MTGKEIRRSYLDFFVSKGHLELPSASLIPENDPSLLMIGAGMAPFKAYFTGKMQPPRTRITTSQRCVRTGDIENVGRTARHHTYFEMLGNFSFGDYFKYDAIKWAWEYLTDVLELPKDKLWVSIYPDDEEAYNTWTTETDINPEHIVKLEDNFWEIGTGPSGPDSEIFIDLGEERGCDSPTCGVGCDCDRYLEIWNLVFTQFDKQENGEYIPLTHKNIDTGCGLERLASVLQNKPSNFETDLMFPIIEYAARISGKSYGADVETDVSLKVIADHLRSISFMVMDGILPSNEGRGYILRRLLRRAVRHARSLGIEHTFMGEGVAVVADIYDGVYTELKNRQDYITKVITLEEERFHQTLSQGMELLNDEIAKLQADKQQVLAGAIGFKLYDTYGFPWELTSEILHEHGLELDMDGFNLAMDEQRQRARAARSDVKRMDIPDLRDAIDADKLTIDYTVRTAKIACIWKDATMVEEIKDGDQAGLILDTTPFYAEGGGQVGDIGTLHTEFGVVEVLDTKKLPDGTVYNYVQVLEGHVATGDTVNIKLNEQHKLDSARNHTATHLLHAALRQVLGNHITQAGSAVDASRLRFDFSSFEPVTAEQLAKIESLINEQILLSTDVDIAEMSKNEAEEKGAMALFGEKYGDTVRVVSVGDFSIELCGGCHVNNIGQIGMFKIVSESGVAAGVRRIEAVTGRGAIAYVNSKLSILHECNQLIKANDHNIIERLTNILVEQKELKAELAEFQAAKAQAEAEGLIDNIIMLKGVPCIIEKISVPSVEELRHTADLLCGKPNEQGSAIFGEISVVVLAAEINNKLNFLVKATKEATKHGIHAGKIVKEIAMVAGGNGGGRPDMAQAGAPELSKVDDALKQAHTAINAQLQ